MNLVMRATLYFCLLVSWTKSYCATCHFYNKTPFDIVIHLNVALARDKELHIPANNQEMIDTGIFPVRSYVIHASVYKDNDKKNFDVQVYESNQMKYRTLKCALFVEPQRLTDPTQKDKHAISLDHITFWVAPEHPEYGEEVERAGLS